MSAYTLKQLREAIDPSCFPPSASSGTKTNLINKAREAVYNCFETGGGSVWQGTQIPVSLVITAQPDGSHTVTLPRAVETIQGCYGTNSGIASVRNEWFSFLRIAPNQQPSGRQLDDLGDGFCGVVEPVATGSYFKIKTTGAEAAALSVDVYGIDAAGNLTHESIAVPTVSGNVTQGAVLFFKIVEVVVPVTDHALLAYLTDPSADFIEDLIDSDADGDLLPTSDPHVVGEPWNNGGVVCISVG